MENHLSLGTEKLRGFPKTPETHGGLDRCCHSARPVPPRSPNPRPTCPHRPNLSCSPAVAFRTCFGPRFSAPEPGQSFFAHRARAPALWPAIHVKVESRAAHAFLPNPSLGRDTGVR